MSDSVKIGWFRQQVVRAQSSGDSLGLCLLTQFSPSLELSPIQQQQVRDTVSAYADAIGGSLMPPVVSEIASEFSMSWLESLQASQVLAKLLAQAQASRAQDSHIFCSER